jgi:hypothetical protein
MPTAGTGQLAGPLSTLAEMFADCATFAADCLADGEATPENRVYIIARTEDEEEEIAGTGWPFVVLYETKGARSDRTLGSFGPVDMEGRIEYLIAEGDSEREAYVKFANKLSNEDGSGITEQLEALADGGGGTLVNFSIEFDEPAMRTDPDREAGDATQTYSSSFKVRCGLEG